LDTSDYSVPVYALRGGGLVSGLFSDGMPTEYIGKRSWALENFTVNSAMFSVITVVLLIYASVLTGSVFGDDYRQNTMRMLALRPVTRNRILQVKTAATAIHLFLAAAAAMLLQIIFSALSVGLDFSTVIMSFGGKAVVLHPVLYIAWLFLNQYVTLLFFMTLSIMLCVLLKSKVVPVVVAAILTQAPQALGPLFGEFGGKSVYLLTFLPHTELNRYFAVSQPFAGMNYWLSLLCLAVYAAIFTLVSYTVFNKRDIS
jgi:ABC-2 type transport system permease protein